jgi:hypothetical protein
VSGTGDASNAGACGLGFAYAASSPGVALDCIAVSGTGDASNQAGEECGQAVDHEGLTLATGCVAFPGGGEASNRAPNCGSTTTGVGVGCVAVSAQQLLGQSLTP